LVRTWLTAKRGRKRRQERFLKPGNRVWNRSRYGFYPCPFPAQLIQLRKALELTQQELAEAAQLHVNQIRSYEAAAAQLTLDALIRWPRCCMRD
jgi:hypothetical protein